MRQGILQAFGVAIYCAVVGIFIWNANHLFGPMNNFFGPILFLIIFSTSALICALIVFYKPYKLFFSGKKNDALSIVVYTAVSLFAILALFLLGILLFR